MQRFVSFVVTILFFIWILPLGIVREFYTMQSKVDHSAPSGCLCAGSSDETEKYTKYVLQDACRSKPLAKFGGAAHNDAIIFNDRAETLVDLSASNFHYSFLYDFYALSLIDHVPKV
ncbi:MAG: hypothetical protein KBD53_09790 [Candidatus Omnitrophica bacterium]|nr:hypothetical protein [Candidatus Omnitrophota bacterium]